MLSSFIILILLWSIYLEIFLIRCNPFSLYEITAIIVNVFVLANSLKKQLLLTRFAIYPNIDGEFINTWLLFDSVILIISLCVVFVAKLLSAFTTQHIIINIVKSVLIINKL